MNRIPLCLWRKNILDLNCEIYLILYALLNSVQMNIFKYIMTFLNISCISIEPCNKTKALWCLCGYQIWYRQLRSDQIYFIHPGGTIWTMTDEIIKLDFTFQILFNPWTFIYFIKLDVRLWVAFSLSLTSFYYFCINHMKLFSLLSTKQSRPYLLCKIHVSFKVLHPNSTLL